MIDVTSETWIDVRTKCAAELAVLCQALETRGMDATDTEYLRGCVSTLRNVLSMGEPAQAFDAPDSVHY